MAVSRWPAKRFGPDGAFLPALPAPSRSPPLCAPPRTEEGQGGGRELSRWVAGVTPR
jgi:hypothetical protein